MAALNMPALHLQIYNFTATYLALTIFVRLTDFVAVLAVARAGHFELRTTILAGCRCELDLFRTHRAFLSCLVHGFAPRLSKSCMAEAAEARLGFDRLPAGRAGLCVACRICADLYLHRSNSGLGCPHGQNGWRF